MVNDEEPSYDDRTNPRKKMVAQLSQNMNFLADMSVGDFLSLHAKCRGASSKCVDAVINLANTLTGEPIKSDHELNHIKRWSVKGLDGSRRSNYQRFSNSTY